MEDKTSWPIDLSKSFVLIPQTEKALMIRNWELACIFKTVKKSLIILARQNKLWEGINSMAIIESEMISHEQLILSSQEH